ncbi:MAG: 3D domain-containing protein, partial [Dethiobacteria bacterium]
EEISIVRIEKIYTSEETVIPFDSVYRENPAMDMGSVCIVCEGEEGLKKETVEIVLADGQEVSRAVIDEMIITPPRSKIIERGTRSVIPGLDVQFNKMLNVKATAYCPGTPGSGCPVDSRGYSVCTGKATGRTATGAKTRGGDGSKQNPYIIAVDPRVIPLRSQVYIEGYGYAVALDTGGAIKGNKIDVMFSSHSSAIRFGRRNLKIYLLP